MCRSTCCQRAGLYVEVAGVCMGLCRVPRAFPHELGHAVSLLILDVPKGLLALLSVMYLITAQVFVHEFLKRLQNLSPRLQGSPGCAYTAHLSPHAGVSGHTHADRRRTVSLYYLASNKVSDAACAAAFFYCPCYRGHL